MECFLQYWDNLDDLYFAIAAQRERFLSALGLLASMAVIAVAALAGYVSARYAPEDALFISLLLALYLLTGSLGKRSTITSWANAATR